MMPIQHYGDIDKLPPELLDQIIFENNDNDFQSIRSASLVSKTWRAVSLRYLFSRVGFYSESDCLRWNTIAESMPHVLAYVQHVTCAPGKHMMKALRAQYTGRGNSPEYHAAVAELFRQGRETVTLDFPDIPTMPSVFSFAWDTPPYVEPGAVQFSPNMERFFRAFPAVTSVFFSSALPIDSACTILSAFPSTKMLTWTRGLTPPPPGGVYAPFIGQLSNLQRLRLWGASNVPLFDWLGRALADSPLRMISLYHTTPISVEKLKRLLKGASDTLVELEVTSDLVDCVRQCVTPNHTLTLGVLQIVTIENIWDPPLHGSREGEMDVIASMLTNLCASASCSMLRFIDLRFWVPDDDPNGDLFSSWKALAHTISRRFPSLEAVYITFLLKVLPTLEQQEVVVKSVKDGMLDLAPKISVWWRRN